VDKYRHFGDYGLRHLPKHLRRLGLWKDLGCLLTDLSYLQARVGAGLTFEVGSDYSAARHDNSAGITDPGVLSVLSDIETFLSLNSYRLARAEEFFLQLAYNYARTGPVASAAEELIGHHDEPWFRLLNRPVHAGTAVHSRVLEGHEDTVQAVALTPDGQFAVSSGLDHTLRVWDIESGRCKRLIPLLDCNLSTIALEPDGQHVIGACEQHGIEVWSLSSAQCVQRLEAGVEGVARLAMIDDGRLISISRDGTSHVWHLDSGKLMYSLKGGSGFIKAMAPMGDGLRLVQADSRGTLHVVDSRSGERLRSFGSGLPIQALAVTADGITAISGGWDMDIHIWRTDDGTRLRTLAGHTNFVNALAIGQGDTVLVSAGGDHVLRIWDIETGECLGVLQGHAEAVVCVAVAADGATIVSGSADNSVRVWDLRHDGPGPSMSDTHGGSVTALAITPDGSRAISGGQDHAVRGWDLVRGKCTWINKPSTTWVTALAAMPDGRRAVSGTGDFLSWRSGDVTRHIWDVETGRCTQKLHDPSRLWDWAKSLSADADARRPANAGGTWNWVKVLAATPDGELVLSAHQDGSLAVWKADRGDLLSTLEGHSDSVTAMALTADGRHAISASLDRTLRIWDISDRRCVGVLECNGIPLVVVPNVDGRTVLSGDDLGNLYGWDIGTAERLRTLGEHTGSVSALCVTPDGQYAISGGRDMKIRLWNLKNMEFSLALEGHSGVITGLCTTRDGQYLMSCSSDKTLRLWNLPKGQQIASFCHQAGMLPCPQGADALRPLTPVSMVSDGVRIVTGDASGQVYLITPENLPQGSPIITAWCASAPHGGRTRRFMSTRPEFAFSCPFCHSWSEVLESALGQELPCHICGETIALNPFAVHADWRPLAKMAIASRR
jgi:WD40 repeat protein